MAFADWTGSSNGDYLDTANWLGGMIDDQFNVSGSSPYVVNLTGDRVTQEDVSIVTAGNSFQLLTPNSTLVSPTVMGLNGSFTFDPGNNNTNIQIGSGDNQPLWLDLGGTTRELIIQPGFRDKRSTSSFYGNAGNGNLIKMGEGELEWRSKSSNVLSGGNLTLLQGRMALFATDTTASWAPNTLSLGYSGANGSGGVLTIRQDANAVPINNSTTVINMNGGSLWFENGTQSNALTAGTLNLTGGRSDLIDRQDNQPKTLHFTDFSRSNYGTVLVGGGQNVPVVVGVDFKVLVTNDSNITSGLIGTSTTPGTTNLKILPWAAATNQRDDEWTPTVRNSPTNGGFLTYDSTNGFRALNLSTEYADFGTAVSDDNAKLTSGGTTTPLGNKTVNSLVFYNNASSPTIDIGGNTLTVTSGAIANLGKTNGDSFQAQIMGSGTIAFGSNTGYLWSSGDGNGLVIQSNISGSAGLVVASGHVKLTGGNNTDLSGPIVVQGDLRVESSTALNANTSIVLAGGSGVNYRADKDNNNWGLFQYTQNITASNLSGVGRLSDEGIKQVNLVGAGGTLANVTGATNQQVTVGNTAWVSPGDPSGGLQQASAIILSNNIQGIRFNNGSTLKLDLASDTQFDQISLWDETGGLTGVRFDLGSTIQITFLDGYLPEVGDNWQVFSIIDKQDSTFVSGAPVTGNANPTFAGMGDAAGYTFSLSNDGVLTVAAVPEPSVLALITLGVGVMLYRVRRSSRRC
jgi:hypothetical protein